MAYRYGKYSESPDYSEAFTWAMMSAYVTLDAVCFPCNRTPLRGVRPFRFGSAAPACQRRVSFRRLT